MGWTKTSVRFEFEFFIYFITNYSWAAGITEVNIKNFEEF